MATQNNISIFKGEAITLTFTMSPVTDIVGWTITFTLRVNANDSVAVLTKTPATIVVPSTSGVFTFSLTHANTNLASGAYAYDVQRVDAGSEAVLSIGFFTIYQEVLYP